MRMKQEVDVCGIDRKHKTNLGSALQLQNRWQHFSFWQDVNIMQTTKYYLENGSETMWRGEKYVSLGVNNAEANLVSIR